MIVGDRVQPQSLEGRRHGVLVEGGAFEWGEGTRSKRRARRVFLGLLDDVVLHPGRVFAQPGDDVVLVRVERGRAVDAKHIHVPGGAGGPDIGIREPRRPRPSQGGAEATA